MTSITAGQGDGGADAPAAPSGFRRFLPKRWALWSLAVVVAAGAGVGAYVWSQYRTLSSPKLQNIGYRVPAAPRLAAGDGETVYRIDPTRSEVGYSIKEKLFGRSARTAHGVTNGIAGDVALNAKQPAKSRVGEIVVNVEQLHSDNNLRDAKIRHDNLESEHYPLAHLTDVKLSGLPEQITQGKKYDFTLESTLTVKDKPVPVRWQADATLKDGTLVAHATTQVKLSQWGIGPISIAGLVSTSDDVTLTMRLTALDPSKHTIPTTIARPKSKADQSASPSFRTAIMPILSANCAACHQSGEVGADHWKFDTAGDAADVSDGIGTVVESKYMPPWPASTKGVALAHSRALSQADIDAIVKWSNAGGPLDVARATKVRPTKGPVGDPPRRDIVLTMPKAYTGSVKVPNDYRCFVLDPKIAKLTYITGFEVHPDQREEIHHAQLFHVSALEAKYARKMEGKDGKPGWTCYGTANVDVPREERIKDFQENPNSPQAQARRRLHGFTGQDSLFAGWVPGQDPVTMPKNLGVPFAPGDAIILQMHYHYGDKATPDRSTVTFQTDAPTKHFKPVDIVNPLAPVEIPCMPGEKAKLCDREEAIKDDVRLYGPAGAFIENGLLLLCGQKPDDLAAKFKDGIAYSSCVSTVPEDGTIISVFGHMHTLGKTFRFTLDPGAKDAKVLLDIPNWNFDWQMNYPLAKPIHVKQGQKLLMECTWDRSLDPNRPPKYIVFAEGTEDEMCFGTYSIVPDKP